MFINEKKQIGERVRLVRGKRSQRWLAEEARVSEVTINRIEQGLQNFTIETLLQIAKALNVSATHLLGGSGPIGESRDLTINEVIDFIKSREKELLKLKASSLKPNKK